MNNNKPSYYLTTPIYYVNGEPHLGTAYTTIAADTLARFKRMQGFDVKFLTGLDEHGQKVADNAAAAGVSPKEWCDRLAPKFTDLWQALNISNDDFIRTTEERHTRAVQRFYEAMQEGGYLRKDTYKGWYCVHEETFYTDEELHQAGHADDHLCPDCGRPLEFDEEENLFFKLSEFEQPLLDFYAAHSDFIQPETRRNEVLSFVKGGLKDLSVSRTSFDWGVPIPFAEGHVSYVWFDALINYLTAVGYGDPDSQAAAEFARRWPAQVHFVGKDIIRFHCVIWPAMLMAAGLPVPERVFAHGFLLTKGEKMSKSRGNAMSPTDLCALLGGGLLPDGSLPPAGVDAYRYYFLSDVQFGADGQISLERMLQVYNADLANSWGNLVSRVLSMTKKYFEGKVPETAVGIDNSLAQIAAGLYDKVSQAMDAIDYSGACAAVMELVDAANGYIENEAPWALAKAGDAAKLAQVMYALLESVRLIALYFAAIMPSTSADVWGRLDLSDVTKADLKAESAWGLLPAGNQTKVGQPLFQRLKESDVL
ncbi:MAG: methionine--tRNA ligase [Coriobacteriales bacterium]|jgi:methionyl-tRNA synthetase|nr:methionine--tRNA ligase [Coriobacteriales bacterium]